MFNFFKKATHKKLEINLHNNSMIINGTSLSFPLSLKDIETVLGKPDQVVKRDNKFIKYIYDNIGIVFEHSFSIKNHLKKSKTYIDEEHLISTVFLYYGDVVKSMTGEKKLPKQPCQAVVLSDGKSPYFFSDRHRVGDFNLILWTPYGTNFNGITETITDTLSISFFPEIKRERESYKLNTTDEEVLQKYIEQFAEQISKWLKKNKLATKTLTIKLKQSDFETKTRSKTLETYVQSKEKLALAMNGK